MIVLPQARRHRSMVNIVRFISTDKWKRIQDTSFSQRFIVSQSRYRNALNNQLREEHRSNHNNVRFISSSTPSLLGEYRPFQLYR